MAADLQQTVRDFYLYPAIGKDDWRYGYATGLVRCLQTTLLTKAFLTDVASAANFNQAVETLSGGDYPLPQPCTLADAENVLLSQRTAVRELFAELMIEKEIVSLFKARDDFANLRLALRRKLMDYPIGVDYSNDGNVPAEDFEHIFEEENYDPLPYYMRDAIEAAVLAYYENKEIRQIDFAIDRMFYDYALHESIRLKHIFVEELFRMQIDFINISTMLRLKFIENRPKDVFLEGGYIDQHKLKTGTDLDYEAVKNLFFPTQYYDIVEAGVSFLSLNKSYQVLEQKCSEHQASYFKLTDIITAGPQPVIAYLLIKEAEIRNIRLILKAKSSGINKEFIIERLVA